MDESKSKRCELIIKVLIPLVKDSCDSVPVSLNYYGRNPEVVMLLARQGVSTQILGFPTGNDLCDSLIQIVTEPPGVDLKIGDPKIFLYDILGYSNELYPWVDTENPEWKKLVKAYQDYECYEGILLARSICKRHKSEPSEVAEPMPSKQECLEIYQNLKNLYISNHPELRRSEENT